jgi:heterotetrameric sarcosine oxidase delta subunit
VSLRIPCPWCGPRPYTEFMFGGEERASASDDPEEDFRRVYLPLNAPAEQLERWFHTFGCRRWLRLRRDALTNRID